MNDKKQTEQKCYETAKAYIDTCLSRRVKKYIYSLFPLEIPPIQTEKPDFIINAPDCDVLIEHFMIDICNDGPNNNQSRSKRAEREVDQIYGNYHDSDSGTIKDCNIEPAVADIEKTINNIVNMLYGIVRKFIGYAPGLILSSVYRHFLAFRVLNIFTI